MSVNFEIYLENEQQRATLHPSGGGAGGGFLKLAYAKPHIPLIAPLHGGLLQPLVGSAPPPSGGPGGCKSPASTARN